MAGRKRGTWKALQGRSAVLSFLGQYRESASRAHVTCWKQFLLDPTEARRKHAQYWENAVKFTDWLISMATGKHYADTTKDTGA